MTTDSTAQVRSHRSARLPLLLLLLQIAVSALVLHRVGLLEPVIRPDTRSYQQASRVTTVVAAFQSHRTQGYPLLLRAMRWITGIEYSTPLPKAHAAIFFSGALFFWFAVRAWTDSAWLALAGTTPLISAPVFSIIPRIQPDFPAAGLALMVMAALLLLARRPANWLLWLLLTVLVLVTYQTRPGYLFLVSFVPLVGWILRLCREGRPRWKQVAWAAGLAVAMALPLLAYSAVRLSKVGHFGLVAFSGFNLIGVTASMLDEEVIEMLPEEYQELAGRIHSQRAQWGWYPMTLDADIRIFHEQFNTNTWRLSINPARRREKAKQRAAAKRGEARRFRDIEVNDTLKGLSREIIRLRPQLYLKWVGESFVVGIVRMLRYPWVLWPSLALLVAFPIAWMRGRIERALDLRLLGLLALCGCYTLAHLLLVVLVSWPHERYLVPIMLLVPTALCTMLYSLWKGPAERDARPNPE